MTGKYTREREIGRGGMGTVWLGKDTVLGRPVAMKRVGLVPGGSVPDLERAEREARLAAALNHPHVVAVFDLVAEGDEHWLVMEHVEGASLAERIRQHGPMDQDAAASVLWQVADALAAAHEVGIVHRDVKPSNILVTADGHAKLTDFGIARAEADASLTQTGLVTGSPAYLAPEVASGQGATAASDMWSLGATLYHALAGRPPYDVGDNVLGALYQIVHEQPPRLADAGWLSPLLEHTMATDPADRWSAARARDFLQERHDSGGTTVAAPLPPVLPPADAPTVPHDSPGDHTMALAPVDGRDPQWLWAVGAVVVLALVVLGFWLGLRNGGEEPEAPATSETPSARTGTSEPTQEEPTPSKAEESTPTAPSPVAMEAFVSGYLDTVTADPKATWEQLTPQFREQSGGFGQYNSFWRTIDDITVVDMQADPEQLTVTYTVRYDLRNGGETTDTVTLLLEPDADGFQVAGES